MRDPELHPFPEEKIILKSVVTIHTAVDEKSDDGEGPISGTVAHPKEEAANVVLFQSWEIEGLSWPKEGEHNEGTIAHLYNFHDHKADKRGCEWVTTMVKQES